VVATPGVGRPVATAERRGIAELAILDRHERGVLAPGRAFSGLACRAPRYQDPDEHRFDRPPPVHLTAPARVPRPPRPQLGSAGPNPWKVHFCARMPSFTSAVYRLPFESTTMSCRM